MQSHLRVARPALRAGCGLAEDRAPVLCASRCPSPSPDPLQPPLPFLLWKMVPAAGRGEWRPPSARGRGDGAGHLREGRAERGGRGVAEGGPDSWVPRAPQRLQQVREKLAGACGGPLAGCLLPRPHGREIVKVSGFLGVRPSAVRPGVPAQGPRDRLGGAPCVRSPLSSEPPRQSRSSSRRQPPPPGAW